MALPLLGSTLVRARRTARLAVLGLTPEASEVEIRRAYLDLVQVWHPDRFEHNPGLKQRAQDTLQAINDA